MTFDDSVPVAENYREHIYFVFKLDEPMLVKGSLTNILNILTNILQIGIDNFCEKHPGSIIILKMVNGPLLVRKEKYHIVLTLLSN